MCIRSPHHELSCTEIINGKCAIFGGRGKMLPIIRELETASGLLVEREAHELPHRAVLPNRVTTYRNEEKQQTHSDLLYLALRLAQESFYNF